MKEREETEREVRKREEGGKYKNAKGSEKLGERERKDWEREKKGTRRNGWKRKRRGEKGRLLKKDEERGGKQKKRA